MSAPSVKDALYQRVKQHHVKCGYCHRELAHPTTLRRHIRTAKHHGPYLDFVCRLAARHAKIPQDDTTDEWDEEAYARLNQDTAALSSAEEEAETAHAKEAETAHAPTATPTVDATVETLLTEVERAGQARLYTALAQASLSRLEACSSSVQDSWKSAGGIPVVMPSREVYCGTPTTEKELFIRFLCSPTSRTRLFIDGVLDNALEDHRKKEMLYELAYDYRQVVCSKVRSSAAFHLENKAHHFTVPRLASDPVPEVLEEAEVILTKTGGLTDLHIDNGKYVVSSPVDPSVRLFFLWPPTQHNLSLLDSHGTRADLLLCCAPKLECGIIEVLDSKSALRMHPGVIHAVLTLTGGFIMTRAYVDEQSLKPMTSWLKHSPIMVQRRLDTEISVLAYNWIQVAELTSAAEVIASWYEIPGLIELFARLDPQAKKRLSTLLARLKRRDSSRDQELDVMLASISRQSGGEEMDIHKSKKRR